jgi:hypothetical protein
MIPQLRTQFWNSKRLYIENWRNNNIKTRNIIKQKAPYFLSQAARTVS